MFDCEKGKTEPLFIYFTFSSSCFFNFLLSLPPFLLSLLLFFFFRDLTHLGCFFNIFNFLSVIFLLFSYLNFYFPLFYHYFLFAFLYGQLFQKLIGNVVGVSNCFYMTLLLAFWNHLHKFLSFLSYEFLVEDKVWKLSEEERTTLRHEL